MSDQWGQQPSWEPESWGQPQHPDQQPQGLPPLSNQQQWQPQQPPQGPQSIPHPSWGQPSMPGQQQWGQPQGYPQYQQGQPYYQQPPQMMPPQPMQPPKKKNNRNLMIGCGVLVVALIVCGIISLAVSHNDSATTSDTTMVGNNATTSSKVMATSTQQPVVGSTQTSQSTPTLQPVHYPPTTEADLRGLAAKEDASAIHEFHSESVGLTGVCPQPKREVTVDPSITGQKLAEDLLAYFYSQQLDSPCGSIVFAYHDQSEAGDVYTAGRINFDVTDSSGAANVNPNATNLKYTLTLDVGGFGIGQEYVVTY